MDTANGNATETTNTEIENNKDLINSNDKSTNHVNVDNKNTMNRSDSEPKETDSYENGKDENIKLNCNTDQEVLVVEDSDEKVHMPLTTPPIQVFTPKYQYSDGNYLRYLIIMFISLYSY